MIWKPLKPLVVAMGNFIFMILYKLASTFEDNKQHKLKKKKHLFLLTFQQLSGEWNFVLPTNMLSKIALANNRRPQ